MTPEIVVNLISATNTETGLEVHAWLDTNDYQIKKEVSGDDLNEVKNRSRQVPRPMEL